ncbi:hypothetical protein F443_22237 [Phytophthora nicotianae P1569]|uniref:Chromo domain-containing protein n=1 Tax=Phytophthora nicotianae P1569 TaxID=1317065 RepID=V9DVI1_PHYNI|nr:hypothetical protein F443_22237 [Phytophthora nicotianae P1569]
MFTGLPCPSPLEAIFVDTDQGPKNIPVVKSSATCEQQLLELKESLVNFSVGDYVLKSRVDEKVGNKLLVTWIGPFVITRADSHSFRVRKLISGKESTVHASRLKFYADKSLNVNEELLEHVASQGIVLKVDGIRDHRWNDRIKDYELLMHWHDLGAIEDSWEPMKSVRKDVRLMVENYEKSDQ